MEQRQRTQQGRGAVGWQNSLPQEEFFRSSYRPLVRDVIFAGAHHDEAEDAVSAAMVEVLERWDTIENPLAYARRTAINHAIRTRQRGPSRIAGRLVERSNVPPGGGPLNSPTPDESLDQLFGGVFDLAGQISQDVIEARLRVTLREVERRAARRAASAPAASQQPATLVSRAAAGDQEAWDQIVERYAPLVWAIGRRYRLTDHDREDVGQRVWLLLVEQIGKLREPAALPGWLATTTSRECQRVLKTRRRADRLVTSQDPAWLPDDAAEVAIVEAEILAAELNAALRAAVLDLPPRCQQLLSMLASDPPHSYAEISAALGIPVGSIGPQRARCLDRLRRAMMPAWMVEEPDRH
jgi:RNA polymerase sigma factor (sigma-70 family)